jgi:hypothetical protein
MDRFNKAKFNGFIGQESVTPLSVPFWWCGASQSGDFGSSDSIKFGGSSGALLVMDDICAEGLKTTPDVEHGGFAHFNSSDDFGIEDAFVSEEQDSGAFDGADVGCAFSGEVLELCALFFAEFNWVDFFSHC